MANGYSSMVFDQRVFVSLNPFNVYVSQPEVKPGCVLRRANVNVLENRKLIRQSEVCSFAPPYPSLPWPWDFLRCCTPTVPHPEFVVSAGGIV